MSRGPNYSESFFIPFSGEKDEWIFFMLEQGWIVTEAFGKSRNTMAPEVPVFELIGFIGLIEFIELIELPDEFHYGRVPHTGNSFRPGNLCK